MVSRHGCRQRRERDRCIQARLQTRKGREGGLRTSSMRVLWTLRLRAARASIVRSMRSRLQDLTDCGQEKNSEHFCCSARLSSALLMPGSFHMKISSRTAWSLRSRGMPSRWCTTSTWAMRP